MKSDVSAAVNVRKYVLVPDSDHRQKSSHEYPKNCWGCVSCVKECKAGAIEFYLGADIGGMGGTMNVTQKGDLINWNITRSDGSELVISVDRRNSNKY